MEQASAAGVQLRKGSDVVANTVPIAATEPTARTKTVPRGLGNPNRPGQPHAITPAARATDTATSHGPANALMVTRAERARTAIVTRGCNGISGTGSTAASALAAARFCARVNTGALGIAGLSGESGLAEEPVVATDSGLTEGSGPVSY